MTVPRSAHRNLPQDIVALDRRPDWVFGASTGHSLRPIALRWQDGRWRDEPTPWHRVSSGLQGGDSVSRSNAWAVGWLRPGPFEPVSAHWDGERWAAVRVPDPAGSDAVLVDVAIVSNRQAWAVGTQQIEGRIQPLVMKWRPAGGWSISRLSTGPGEAGLTSVEAAPDGGLWATGWQTVGGRPRPLLAKRVSGRWSISEGASLPAGTAILTDLVFRSGSQAYVSGLFMPTSGETLPIVERWNGTSWSLVGLSWAHGLSAVARSVAVGADGTLTVVGTRLADDRRRARGYAARLVSGTWSVTEFDDPPASSEMNSVAAIDGGAIAVGNRSSAVRIRQTCGGSSSAVVRAPADVPLPAYLDRATDHEEGAPVTLGSIRVREVASDVGLGMVSRTYGGHAANLDRDGWPDLFIGRHSGTPWLGLGGPGGFDRVGWPFHKGDRHGCAMADVDDDGFTDIYCTQGANKGIQTKGNDLLLRAGNPGASQAAAAFGVLDPFGRGRQATFFHLDDDRYPELYVTNEPERVDGLPSTNRLYGNVAGERFRSMPEQGADVSIDGDCARSGDVDDDGDDDLLVCAVEPWRGRGPGLRAFRNDGGTLDEATAEFGIPEGFTLDAITADLDGDRDAELIQVMSGRIVISRWQGGRLSVTREIAVRSPVAVAAGDADGDRDLDLFVVRGGFPNRRDLLFLNGGSGTSFSSVTMPVSTDGVADSAIRIDHDRNGLDDFVVLNGGDGRPPGRIQLFAFYR